MDAPVSRPRALGRGALTTVSPRFSRRFGLGSGLRLNLGWASVSRSVGAEATAEAKNTKVGTPPLWYGGRRMRPLQALHDPRTGSPRSTGGPDEAIGRNQQRIGAR